ncbi:AAA family ATPase [Nodularia spumigena]|uniref:AAA family ATPase n=1 Tax=Nodularia spumigena TaxID=70799 RepID=UPI002B1F1D33|nr:MoxR family ATPase [Nodularia spumigena]MEA5614887.1 MoxR family ATPase [Nodularia spumigena UHCC 0040]
MNEPIRMLRDQIARVYLGDPGVIDQLICCLLARGHALLEDVPGVGKTVLASALARSIDCPFNRVQLTPDMLPADIIGVTIFDREGRELRFQKGPLFTGILLADEINRTTPRTQSALLEAMSDGSVSVDGKTYPLHKPFMVVATQNPMGFEGTYPLPENQLDRFLMRITLGYPTAEAEERLLDLRPASTVLDGLNSNTDTETVVMMQESVDRVHMSPALRAYIVALARATRESPEFRVGISPRGSLALAQAARAWAWMQSRDHVIPEDVLTLLGPVCAHRTVSADPRAQSDHDRAAELLAEVTRSVPAPV